MRLSHLLSFALVGLMTLASSMARATDWNESVNGDLSGDRLNPTPIAGTLGSNLVTATSMSGDIEYFRLTVPAGTKLSAVVAVSNTSPSLSFIAVQRSATFTEPPTGTVVGNLLGYAHFGPANGTIGTDILDNMGTGSGSMGFVPPLTAGTYTFWSQETSASPSTYVLDFQLTTAPTVPLSRGAIFGLAVGLAAVGAGFVLRMKKPPRRRDAKAIA